ncbi:DNA-binding protein, partial [Klebsiella pneumoniae]|nr:DNA-binding protein [Klebsiella pneumoniae]
MSKLSKSLSTLARQAGGSFKTVADRMKIADRMAERMLNLNIQIRDVRHIKEGANKQVISSQADSLIKISRIWA